MPHANALRWLSFALDEHRYALPLDTVTRVVRAAEITPLPLAPAIVAGALDIAGRVLPVFNLRRRLRLPDRDLRLDDQFVIARTPRRDLALVVDAALGLIDATPADVCGSRAGDLPHLRGVLSQPDGLVLIQDLENFLSPDEDAALESALRAAEASCTPTR